MERGVVHVALPTKADLHVVGWDLGGSAIPSTELIDGLTNVAIEPSTTDHADAHDGHAPSPFFVALNVCGSQKIETKGSGR